MNEDRCSRCGKVIELYEPYQEDEDGVKTHGYPERYCKKKDSKDIVIYWGHEWEIEQ